MMIMTIMVLKKGSKISSNEQFVFFKNVTIIGIAGSLIPRVLCGRLASPIYFGNLVRFDHRPELLKR